jgi:cobalt transporter subunit CbtB
MITAIKNNSTFRSNYLSMIGAALLGLAIVTISGHVQGNVLHDAAHDVRHTTGFPCH